MPKLTDELILETIINSLLRNDFIAAIESPEHQYGESFKLFLRNQTCLVDVKRSIDNNSNVVVDLSAVSSLDRERIATLCEDLREKAKELIADKANNEREKIRKVFVKCQEERMQAEQQEIAARRRYHDSLPWGVGDIVHHDDEKVGITGILDNIPSNMDIYRVGKLDGFGRVNYPEDDDIYLSIADLENCEPTF
jgi:hypothetical protein